MGAYRYLLFPKHQQPTAEEAAELQSYAPLLKGRWAVGHERKSEALALLFDDEVFQQAMADEGFEMLIRRWQTHGCELVDKLKFVKDASALKPTHAHVHERHLSQDKIMLAKKYLADEAIAKSLLSVQRTLERMTWLERVGKAVPYALMVLGMIGVIAVGAYIFDRVQNADRERRTETIERLATDAVTESPGATTSDATPAGQPVDVSATEPVAPQ
jgi:hypothetical protein